MICCVHGSKFWRWFLMGVFALGAAYYLWEQHRAHVLQYLPFAFFLICPLMHFLPGGCHQHKKEGSSDKENQTQGGPHA